MNQTEKQILLKTTLSNDNLGYLCSNALIPFIPERIINYTLLFLLSIFSHLATSSSVAFLATLLLSKMSAGAGRNPHAEEPTGEDTASCLQLYKFSHYLYNIYFAFQKRHISYLRL